MVEGKHLRFTSEVNIKLLYHSSNFLFDFDTTAIPSIKKIVLQMNLKL